MTYRRPPVRRNSLALALVLVALAGAGAPARDLSRLGDADLVDLTHAFGADTIYWPTARRFTLEPVAHGHTAGGWWSVSSDCPHAGRRGGPADEDPWRQRSAAAGAGDPAIAGSSPRRSRPI